MSSLSCFNDLMYFSAFCRMDTFDALSLSAVSGTHFLNISKNSFNSIRRWRSMSLCRFLLSLCICLSTKFRFCRAVDCWLFWTRLRFGAGPGSAWFGCTFRFAEPGGLPRGRRTTGTLLETFTAGFARLVLRWGWAKLEHVICFSNDTTSISSSSVTKLTDSFVKSLVQARYYWTIYIANSIIT